MPELFGKDSPIAIIVCNRVRWSIISFKLNRFDMIYFRHWLLFHFLCDLFFIKVFIIGVDNFRRILHGSSTEGSLDLLLFGDSGGSFLPKV
jgi:hypothetical protein